MPVTYDIAPSKAWFAGRLFLREAKTIIEREPNEAALSKRPKELEIAIELIRRGLRTLVERAPTDTECKISEVAPELMVGVEIVEFNFKFKASYGWYHFEVTSVEGEGKELTSDQRLKLAIKERLLGAINALDFAKKVFHNAYVRDFEKANPIVLDPHYGADLKHDRNFWDWEELDAARGMIWIEGD